MARNETMAGFEVFELPTYQTSAKEFAEKHKVDYPTAQGFIKFLVKQGVARQLQSRKIEGQKGKPTNIYEIPRDVRVAA
jgi:response regulator of citrate/malate metabolism